MSICKPISAARITSRERSASAPFSYHMAQFLEFRDAEVCRRVREIKRADVAQHPNGNFRIRVIEDETAFRFGYVMHIVAGIKRALDEGRRRYVLILPAPNPHYAFVAKLLNDLNIPCHHVHTFNMDEYADQDGNTAPRSWRGGFQYWMWHDLFGRIKPELRMPENQIHFPNTHNVKDYTKMIEDLGGADVCYGGIGWSGHIAFFEPQLGREFVDDIDGYLQLGARIVELHPITVLQNCLYADAGSAGDWSWVPPKAATIGPKDLANSKLVSFWNGLGCGEAMWQRFITRLAAHGPVTPLVPASILQILTSELVLSGPIAADCSLETSERRVEIQI
jgi:glucosamine-6-phosphate deaminase